MSGYSSSYTKATTNKRRGPIDHSYKDTSDGRTKTSSQCPNASSFPAGFCRIFCITNELSCCHSFIMTIDARARRCILAGTPHDIHALVRSISITLPPHIFERASIFVCCLRIGVILCLGWIGLMLRLLIVMVSTPSSGSKSSWTTAIRGLP